MVNNDPKVNNEHIEISIKEVLNRVWYNKFIATITFILLSVAGSIYIISNNYNRYSYVAVVKFPTNYENKITVNLNKVQSSLKFFFEKNSSLNFIVEAADGRNNRSFNLVYNTKNKIDNNVFSKQVSRFIMYLNSFESVSMNVSELNSLLTQTNEHIKFLNEKLKELNADSNLKQNNLMMIMLQDKLIKYDADKELIINNLKKSEFKLGNISLTHTVKNKLQYMLFVLFLSAMLSVFAALSYDLLKKKL